MSFSSNTETKSSRRQWAELNVEGAPTLEELRQALVAFDAGDASEAIADCEHWNYWCCEATGQHEMDLIDWYRGIEDAIEERAK